MTNNIDFRYLQIRQGYQKGSLFDGYKTKGYWVIDKILHTENGFEVDVVEEGLYLYSNTTIYLTVTLKRYSFTDPINLLFIGLPTSVTASYVPVNDSQFTVTLVCGDLTANNRTRYDVTATGTPIPARNKIFSLYSDFGWRVGQITAEVPSVLD